MKSFSEAHEDWRKNLLMGNHLDVDEVGNAMMASRVSTAGKTPEAVSEHWSGFPKEGKTIEDVRKAFAELFNNREGPTELQFNAMRCWADDLEVRTGWYFRADASVYFSASENDVDMNVIAHAGSPVLKAMKAFAEEYIDDTPPPGSVYMMVMAKSGPKFHNVGKGGLTLTRENYDPAVLDAYDRIKTELTSVAPRGRLTILSGPPGCGKTYLIRGMLQEVADAVFVICPQHALAGLVDPSGLTALTELRTQHRNVPVVLILEDADDALAPRQEGDTSTISALLNLGDGITGSVLDMRIVATTNRKQQEFDAAILRPGRLSTATEVGALSMNHANERLLNLLGGDEAALKPGTKPFEGPATIAEVYQRAYDSNWQPAVKPAKKSRMGFGGD